jgi:integrase
LLEEVMAKRKHLTDAGVAKHTRPSTGRIELKDVEPGLSMRITPSGVKSWSVVYRLAKPGEEKRTVKKRRIVGHYPGMGVAEARIRAREINDLARRGLDPNAKEAEDRKVAQHQAAEAAAGSFSAVAERFVLAMQAGDRAGGRGAVTPKTAEGRRRLLERYVLPTIGDLPLIEITTHMVRRLIDDVADQVSPAGKQVDDVLAVVRLVFKFAAAQGYLQGPPPTLGLENRRAKSEKKGLALTDAELRELWVAADDHGSFGKVIRLLMLTGQRRGEIAALKWGEVDFDRRLLMVPVERVKNRAGEHEVVLSDAALNLLREVASEASGTPQADTLVFPSEAGGGEISGWSKLKPLLDRTVCANRANLTDEERRALRATGALRDETRAKKAEAVAKIESIPKIDWRIHDLRHTFITRCRDGEENAEGEVVWSAPLDVLQATVNHKLTAGVTARYDHGDLGRRYRLRKRELLDWWARKLMVIVGEAEPQDNVVPMPARAG